MPSTVRALSPGCKTPNPQVSWNRLPLLRRVRTVPFFPLLDLCIISFICLLISPYNYIIKLIGFETPWTLDPPTEGFRWGRGLHSPRRDVPNCTPTHCTFGNDKLWNMSELYAIVRGHVLSAPENRTFWNDRGRPRGTRSLSPGWPPGSNHFRNVSFWCVLLQWSISSLPDFNYRCATTTGGKWRAFPNPFRERFFFRGGHFNRAITRLAVVCNRQIIAETSSDVNVVINVRVSIADKKNGFVEQFIVKNPPRRSFRFPKSKNQKKEIIKVQNSCGARWKVPCELTRAEDNHTT